MKGGKIVAKKIFLVEFCNIRPFLVLDRMEKSNFQLLNSY